MEILEICNKVIEFVIPALKSKVVNKIKDDFKDAFEGEGIALWEKIKPLFIQEDKSMVEKIESNPDDELSQVGIKYLLSKKMEEDSKLKTDIEEFFNSEISSQQGKTVINARHYGTGDIIGRDKNIYHK